MSDHADASRRWEGQKEKTKQSDSCRELFGVDGETIESEWNIFPGLTSLEILQKIQKDLQEEKIEPETFRDRINIEWTRRGNSDHCISNFEQVKKYATRFSQGHWTFFGLGIELQWYGTQSYFPEGK